MDRRKQLYPVILQFDNPEDLATAERYREKMLEWFKTPLSEKIAASTASVSMRLHKRESAHD